MEWEDHWSFSFYVPSKIRVFVVSVIRRSQVFSLVFDEAHAEKIPVEIEIYGFKKCVKTITRQLF